RHTRWPRDWSSDVCSSDLAPTVAWRHRPTPPPPTSPRSTSLPWPPQLPHALVQPVHEDQVPLRVHGQLARREEVHPAQGLAVGEIGRASCRERGERRAVAG